MANNKGKQLFFPLVVLVSEDLTVEAQDPEIQDPETWDLGMCPHLVTQDLEAVPAQEEVNISHMFMIIL